MSMQTQRVMGAVIMALVLIARCSGLLMFLISQVQERYKLKASAMPPPDVPPHLQEEARVLRSWAYERGASSKQAERIVALLDADWMRHINLPPRTSRKLGVPEYLWQRYLFRRHVQHILRWTTRREESDLEGFGNNVNTIIRESLFPEPQILSHGEIEVRSSETCGESSLGRREHARIDNHDGRNTCSGTGEWVCRGHDTPEAAKNTATGTSVFLC